MNRAVEWSGGGYRNDTQICEVFHILEKKEKEKKKESPPGKYCREWFLGVKG